MGNCPHCGGNRFTDLENTRVCSFCGTKFPAEILAEQAEPVATGSSEWDELAVWGWVTYLMGSIVTIVAAWHESLLPLQGILSSISSLLLILYILKIKRVGIVEAFILCGNGVSIGYFLIRMGNIARGM